MNATYGETQCQYKVELHTELEVPPHGQGQCFTQHERHPHTELKVQAPHEETHYVQNKEAQIQTAFVNGEKRTSQGRLISMLFGKALERRLSTPPSRCRRRSRLRPRWSTTTPTFSSSWTLSLEVLCLQAQIGTFCSKIKVSTHSAKVCKRESN